MAEDALDWNSVISVLDDMHAAGIISKYAVGGAMAAVLYDEAISTVDLDIFFFFSDPQNRLVLSLEEIYKYAREHHLTFDHEFIHISGWLVQFVEASLDPLWSEGVEQARRFIINGQSVAVIGPEHLAAMWAQAGRAKDLVKIEAFADGGVMDRQKLGTVLDRFGLMAKWRSIQGGLASNYQF